MATLTNTTKAKKVRDALFEVGRQFAHEGFAGDAKVCFQVGVDLPTESAARLYDIITKVS